MIKRYGLIVLGLVLCLGVFFFSCQKEGLKDYVAAVHPFPDSTSDVRSVLKKSPFDLFEQAAERVNLDSLMPAGSYFTIFAPVDSAMISAGLDKNTIASLSVDSLSKIVLFHVAQGAYGMSTLSSATYNIEMQSLRQDLTIDETSASSILYQQLLYAKISDVLYVNGEPEEAAGDTAWTATNGYIWPVNHVLHAPKQNIWQIVQSRPELSLYYLAMHIDDSIYAADYFLPAPPFIPNQYYDKSVAGDSISFSWVVYANLPNTQTYGFARPTVFAPTNAAFNAAGIYTYQDILDYNASEPNPGPVTDMNTWVTTWVYLPMDSVLKDQLIIYAGDNTGVKIPYHISLYNDLKFNPDINDGAFNTVDFWHLGNAANAPVPNPLLQFSDNSGTVNIKWQPGAPAAVLPAERSRHIMANNGVIYEIDKLFYPHN